MSARGGSPLARRPSIIEPTDDVEVPELEALPTPPPPAPQVPPPPPAPHEPKASVNRADMRRLLLNINTSRTTTNVDELDNCMEHAYFILLTMHESNRSAGRQTSVLSEMMTLINSIQDTIYEYYDCMIEDEVDMFRQLDPMLNLLRDKYIDLMNQVDIVSGAGGASV